MQESIFSSAPAHTALHISEKELAHNLGVIRQKTTAQIMAVIKNNGYGMGLLPYARQFADAGISAFGVTRYEEAIALRQGGIAGTILLFVPEYDKDRIANLILQDITMTLSNTEQLSCIRQAAKSLVKRPIVHIKIDTGFHRYGFQKEELAGLAPLLTDVETTGVYTHFIEPHANPELTKTQFARFQQAIGFLKEQGISPGVQHCCASGAMLLYPEMHLDLVRVGSAFLGNVPKAASYGLHPAAGLLAPIVSIKQLKKGDLIGYSGRIKARKNGPIGILPIGHIDGFLLQRLQPGVGFARAMVQAMRRKKQLNHLSVSIGGKRAPVIAAIGLNHVAIDLSGIACKPGDLASIPFNFAFCPANIDRLFHHESSFVF